MKPLFLWLLSATAALATLTVQDTGSATATVRSFEPSDLDLSSGLSVTDIAVPQSGGGSTSYSTVNGMIYAVTTGASVKHNKQVGASFVGRYAPTVSATWSSSNTAVATVNASGLATHLTDGASTISCSTPFGTWSDLISFATTASSTSVFSSWVTGLLPADMNSEVDNLIAASGTGVSLLATANDTTGVYTRATNLWTGNASGMTPSSTLSAGSPVDFSGVSVWNNRSDSYGAKFQITLITPTDAISVMHEVPATGTQYRFVDNSNVTYTATVASTAYGTAWTPGVSPLNTSSTGVGGTNQTVYTDIAIEHLTWSGATPTTPTTLKCYKVLPSNYEHFVPSGAVLNYFPLVGVDQERQAFVGDMRTSNLSSAATEVTWGSGAFYYIHFFAATETNRSPYNPVASQSGQTPIWSGDSGDPVFALVKGDPVLVGNVNTSAITASPVSDYEGAINSALTALGSAYQLTVANLTGEGFSTQW